MEYIVQWAEDNRSYEQKYKEQMCFHMCELFGVSHINCGLMETYSVEHTAQKLKELCGRAGSRPSFSKICALISREITD